MKRLLKMENNRELWKFFILIWIGIFCTTSFNAQNLKIHYSLSSDTQGSSSVNDESGNNLNGTLLNGAVISEYDGTPVIDLGNSNGYVDMGSQTGDVIASLNDFAMMVKLYIPSTTSLNSNGNFVWSFANSNNIAAAANGCLFYSAKNGRYAISPTNYTQESGITGSQLTKGEWKTVIYTQRDGTGKIYIDGIVVASGNITMNPSELGATPYNYLGRSSYSSDVYLVNAKIAEFRLYDGALSLDQVEELSGFDNSYYDTKVLAKYNFESVSDTSGNFTGSLNSGAELKTYGSNSVLDLGNGNGYFDFGTDFGSIVSQLDSFSLSTNMFIPATTDLGGNGNFVLTFANSTNMATTANGNMFFAAGSSRYAISKTNWVDESTVKIDNELPKGVWFNMTYTQRAGLGRIFIDGNLKAQGTITVIPKDLGTTPYNFLGRSCYSGDNYLSSALFDNFVVYQGALKESDIWLICESLNPLKAVQDSLYLSSLVESFTIPNADSVRSELFLNTTLGDGISITWESSDPDVVAANGSVTRPANGSDPVSVTLTATFNFNNVTNVKDIDVTVLPNLTDAESVQSDLAQLSIEGNTNNIRSSIHLPITTPEGCTVVWESDSPEYLNNIGKVVSLSPLGNGKKKVVLTATLIKGEEKANRTFEVWVAEEEDRSAYLFTYFTGNDTNGEQIRFAVSSDGYNYTPLNNGNPIMSSDTISLKQGVRDPHILRGEDGNTFYMVVTDMKSAEGWSSNRGMVLLKSNDLVNWTHSTVHFPTKWPETWGNVLRVWAPQTIYDPVAGKYMVYYSLYTGDATCPYDRIYYNYVNDDFTDLIGEPEILYDRGTATIDGDIVYNEVDELYYMFFKNESLGGISQVTSTSITALEGQQPGYQWSEPSKPLQQTTEAVEGAGVFRLINTDNWVLMYDCYSNGHYQYCSSSDLRNFTYVRNDYSISARHGTSISISEEEVERLIAKWPSSALSNVPLGARNPRIRKDGCEINSTAKTIHIAVNYGTDLTDFDPVLYASPGTTISPAGSQDFTSGDINYSFTQNGSTVNYTVSADVEANPVIPDFHADPEVLYSKKTGRFYIYPTTDGYPGWGGYYFDVFSSPDLVNWTNEGTILDLSTDQVSWATGNAWAPCIEEKKVNGSYKYYFFFSGNAGIKKLGVAVANDPSGPFFDSGAPIISNLPDGVGGGQQIDSDVFTDPVSGKTYIYWGNGYMAVAELSDDMLSLKPNTTEVITPSGGTLSNYAYREGTYVFYRNGVYYFLWSVDDTGAANYHVAYGTSTSPTGPINVASQPIVIIQDAANEIYGTGHNSILQIPGRDEWYIVYHRINKNYISDSPGTHREVCIDRLYFNEDGTIQQVTPTKKGIDPVILDHTVTGFKYEPLKLDYSGLELDSVEIYDLYGKKIGDDIRKLKTGIYLIKETFKNGFVKTTKYLAIKE